MKICWDNLEKHGIRITKRGNFRDKKGNNYYYHEHCAVCKLPYLSQSKKGNKKCSKHCAWKDNDKLFNTSGKNNGFYGKKHSEETKENNRQKHLNIKASEITRRILSDINRKNSNPNWKGGSSYVKCSICGKEFKGKGRTRCNVCYKKYKLNLKLDRQYRKTYPPKWNIISKKIRKFYNYTCQNPFCENKNKYIKIDTHHIDYNKQNCNDSNLIALCKKCHSQTNFNRDWYISFYKEIKNREKLKVGDL